MTVEGSEWITTIDDRCPAVRGSHDRCFARAGHYDDHPWRAEAIRRVYGKPEQRKGAA